MLGHAPPEEQIIEGESLRLSCIVVLGTPKPILQWYKDAVPVQASDSIMVRFLKILNLLNIFAKFNSIKLVYTTPVIQSIIN